ncbi:MAG: anthranilate phosphoribosyltransferase, partial [Gemmatimonadota bacterium]
MKPTSSPTPSADRRDGSSADGRPGGHGPSGIDLPSIIARASSGAVLSSLEAEEAFHRIMEGDATHAQMTELLVALRDRGAAPGEVAGGVRALRRAMIPVRSDAPDELVDTCGTGGGTTTTFNISTAAAFVAAGAGVRVAKHGNRSFSSRSGSADVLEALGVRIELEPAEMERALAEAGIVFMFAPLLHPAMRHIGPVRRELGGATIMNLLGPLTNPASARRQVVGVSDPAFVPLIVEALRELGHTRALVVHGAPGLDELSPLGETRVAELVDGEVRETTVTPEALGVEPCTAEAIGGGSPAENAQVILEVLRGEARGGPRSAVLLNAGAAIHVAGLAESLREGVALA